MTERRQTATGTTGRGHSRGILLLALLLPVMGGCLDYSTVETEPSSLWQATLNPVETNPGSELPRVSGQAAFVVRSGATRAGLGLDGVDRDLYWGVFRESCTSPGNALLGAEFYPVIQVGAEDVETTLPVSLTAENSYNIRIATSPDMDIAVACGNLDLIE